MIEQSAKMPNFGGKGKMLDSFIKYLISLLLPRNKTNPILSEARNAGSEQSSMEKWSLLGSTALVTGGTKGIGYFRLTSH